MPDKANLSAYDVARDTGSPESPEGINFSLDPSKTAGWLRDIASRIEAKQIYLSDCKVFSRARMDEYPITFVRLSLIETVKRK